MIEVSVILPVFNAAETLGACIGAILVQDFDADRYEIITVDNNSTDNSVSVLREFPSVRRLAESRQGAYAARNRGLAEARGDLVVFTDPDCVPRRDWLRQLVAAMADEGTKVVMGRDRPAGTSLGVRLLGEYDHYKESFVMSSSDPAIYYGHTNNLITRRALLDEFGGFDQRPRGADVIFVHEVISCYGAAVVRYQPGAMVIHLEISSVQAYLGKVFLYGASAHSYSSVIDVRPLRNVERFGIFKRTAASTHMTLIHKLYLFILLVTGVVFYEFGWLGAAVESRFRRMVSGQSRAHA